MSIKTLPAAARGAAHTSNIHTGDHKMSASPARPARGLLYDFDLPQSQGLLGNIGRDQNSASDGGPPSIPHWLQTAMPFGMGLGPSTLVTLWPSSAPPIPPETPPASPSELPRSSFDPSSPSLWYPPFGANAGFPTQPISDDLFARAAIRTRPSVQPDGGRQEGAATAVLENYLPHAARQLLTLPQRAFEASERMRLTGQYDPGPVVETALMMVGSPLTPRGALGSSAGRGRGVNGPPLPMDEASRMRRAQEMGFHTQMPLYHGTSGKDFRGFHPSKRGSMTQAPQAREGVWSALNPEVAAEFAEMAARKNPDGQRILPLLHRAENPARLRLKGTETHQQIAATLSVAFERGFDAVLVKNYTSPGGRTKQDILVVKNENQLRSRFAKFDPAKRNSRDLSASIAALLGPGVAVHVVGDSAQETSEDAFWDAWRRGDAL